MAATKQATRRKTASGSSSSTRRRSKSPPDGSDRSSGKGKAGQGSEGGRAPSRRSLWKGAITFGLITIPVGLYSAVEERDIHFHMLDARDGSRIRYKRVNGATGEEVDREHIVKGYEFEKGRYVTFTDEELDRIPAESFRTIDVVQFVDRHQIDPVLFQTTYYVAPEEAGLKAYSLMAEALEKSGRVGLAKVTLRDKERLATLRPHDGVLMLETMNWPDEIRAAPFDTDRKPSVSAKEIDMAERLIDELTEDFDPGRFRDTYRERLEKAIKAKIEGEEVSLAPEEAAPSEEVSDLMAALRASVEAARSKGRAKAG